MAQDQVSSDPPTWDDALDAVILPQSRPNTAVRLFKEKSKRGWRSRSLSNGKAQRSLRCTHYNGTAIT
jgi:hypothetical protein